MQQAFESQGQEDNRRVFEESKEFDSAMDAIQSDVDVYKAVGLLEQTNLPETIKEWAIDEVKLINQRL